MRGTTLKARRLSKQPSTAPRSSPLDSAETKVLFDALCDLYAISRDGIHKGKEVVHIANPSEWIRADASRAKVVKSLVEADHGQEVWEMLAELQPELAQRLTTALVHKRRQACLAEFELSLIQQHDEEYWRQLLRANSWIFGGGNVAIVDESRIDLNHIADIPFEVAGGFMDIVELKKPDFPFWTMSRTGQPWRYRKKFLTPHPELNGAIAQMRLYILQAEKHVADADFQRNHGVVPLKPRGLVVHGRSNDWDRDEWEAYRLLNDGLHGVQILTFDHLLEQARRMLAPQ